jgi:TPR repeat protein
MGKILNEEDMDGCDETEKLVKEWFEKAHANDPVEAAYEIGEYYEYNYRKEMALKWYMRSGETGHKVAQYRVGALLNNEDEREYSPIKVDKHKSL